ncbi:hypothetical protein GCM10009773_28310 [Williamsia serinedens]
MRGGSGLPGRGGCGRSFTHPELGSTAAAAGAATAGAAIAKGTRAAPAMAAYRVRRITGLVLFVHRQFRRLNLTRVQAVHEGTMRLEYI